MSEISATDRSSGAPRRSAQEVPGPRDHPLLGSLKELKRDRLALLMRLMNEFGDVVKMRLPGMTMYHVHHPDGIRHVLQDNQHNYHKGPVFDNLRLLVGKGLFTSEGDEWLRQRRLMQPAFHRQRITEFGSLMTGLTNQMLARWDVLARSQRPIDLADEMVHLTMAIISQAMFGTLVSDETNAVSRAIEIALGDFQYRFERPFYPPPFIPTLHNRRFRAALAVLDRTVFEIIERRRKDANPANDLLSMLMAAREEGGTGMDDRQLRDEIVTIFIAGHETTARALAWTFYLLDRNPDAEKQLQDELAYTLNGRTPQMSDLPNLSYTRMVIDEALRIYPPVWITSRQALNEDEIMGFRIPPGALVSIAPYATHRHQLFWRDPERFDPSRFALEQSEGRPKFAYLPFGGGPRQCIGNTFALTEAVLVLATIAQHYCLRVPAGHHVEVLPGTTLQPAGGLPMYIWKRRNGQPAHD